MRFLLLSLACLRACSARFHCFRFIFALASVVLASLPLADRAQAAFVEWANPAGGWYDVGSNWVGGARPTATQNPYFLLNNSYTIKWDSFTASVAPSASSLGINNGAVVFQNYEPSTQWDFTIDGGAIFTGASLTIRGLHLKHSGNWTHLGGLTIDGDSPVGSKMTFSDPLGLQLSTGYLSVLSGGVVASPSGYLGKGGVSNYGVATVSGLGSQWNNSSALQVGSQGSGYLYVQAGGVVTNTEGNIGYDSGSSGQVVVSGSGSKWNNSGELYVARAGNGTLKVEAGGVVTDALAVISAFPSTTAAATVTGSGSQWNHSTNLYVGYFGNGTMNVEAGGKVTNTLGSIGTLPGSTGTATVTGSGSQWNTAGNLSVGGDFSNPGGTGTLTIADNGLVSVVGTTKLWSAGTLNLNGGRLTTGSFDNSQHGTLNFNDGTLTVNGAGGTFNPGTSSFSIDGNTASAQPSLVITNTASLPLSNFLIVGDFNKGNLTVSAGGTVSNMDGRIGYNSGATGTATVTGSGSQWNVSAELDVARTGNGTLNVEAGGKVTNFDGYIGLNPGSMGAATVTGSGSQWINAGSLYVAGDSSFAGGTGVLTIADNGLVSVAGTTKLWSGGTLSLNGGRLTTGSFDNSQLGTLNFDDGTLTVGGAGGTFNPGAPNFRINGNTAAAAPSLVITGTASFTLSDFLIVGDTNKGNLTVSAGGAVSNTNNGIIGSGIGSTGVATVTGTGSQWNNSGQLHVGNAGYGSLNVQAGGLVTNTAGVISFTAGFTGVATVTGGGSRWNNSDALFVGYGGNGTLNVEAGGVVSSSDGVVGYTAGSTGTATVTGAGSRWNSAGELQIAPAGTGTLNVANGGVVSVGSLLSVGSLGTLKGNGGIVGNVFNGGVVAPGNSAGMLTITGNYTDFGQLQIELGGTTPGTQYDQIHVTGQVWVDGVLNVSLINGFVPQSGYSFDFLDWGTITGTFDVILLPALPGSLTWNTSQLYTAGILSVGQPGDFNANGVVDAADYVVWRKTNGSPAAYNVWRSRFGQPPGSGAGANGLANATVPEPATLVLLIFAAAGWSLRRVRET